MTRNIFIFSAYAAFIMFASACGVKPNALNAPEDSDPTLYPRVYPAPEIMPYTPQNSVPKSRTGAEENQDEATIPVTPQPPGSTEQN